MGPSVAFDAARMSLENGPNRMVKMEAGENRCSVSGTNITLCSIDLFFRRAPESVECILWFSHPF